MKKLTLSIIICLLAAGCVREYNDRKRTETNYVSKNHNRDTMICKTIRSDMTECVSRKAICLRWHNGYGSSMQCEFK